MYASVSSIKAASPYTKVIEYKNVAATNNSCQYDAHRSTGVSYCYASQSHPEWFLKDAAGNPFTFCDYTYLYWMDIGNTAYQQQWINDVIAAAKADGVDGIFLDDVNTHPGHCMDNNGLLRYTDAQYGQAMVNFMAAVGPALKAAGLIVIPNVSGDPWNTTQENYALQIAPYSSAYFREFFMHWNSSTNTVFTDVNWDSSMSQMENVSKLTSFIGNTYSSNAADTATAVYGRASFLLGWNGDSTSAYQFHADCQCDSYSNTWTKDMGTPTNARYQVGSAWRREFTGGTAIVNPSSTQTATVSLGGTYLNASGASVTSVTLAPATAAILTKASVNVTDTIPPSVQLTAPVNGNTVSGTTNVTASATDNVGITRIEFYVDNALKQSGTGSTYAWDTSSYTNASHTLQVRAYDAAGNVGASAAATITVSNSTPTTTAPDTTPPTLSITSPANGARVRGSVTISAKASDNVGVTSIELYLDGKLYASAQSYSISAGWNTSPKRVGYGTHIIKAVAKDAAGNSSSTSISVTK
jgi:endo-alpha-1,4-polygalactosaminidase (GH114 family)